MNPEDDLQSTYDIANSEEKEANNMTPDKTSETKNEKVCPNCGNFMNKLIGGGWGCVCLTKPDKRQEAQKILDDQSVGKAEDKKALVVTTEQGLVGGNLSSAPKSEKCTHEWIKADDPCYCDLSGGNMNSQEIPHETEVCKKCWIDKCVFDYTDEIRQQSELKGFNEGIDNAVKLIDKKVDCILAHPNKPYKELDDLFDIDTALQNLETRNGGG